MIKVGIISDRNESYLKRLATGKHGGPIIHDSKNQTISLTCKCIIPISILKSHLETTKHKDKLKSIMDGTFFKGMTKCCLVCNIRQFQNTHKLKTTSKTRYFQKTSLSKYVIFKIRYLEWLS